MTAPVTIPVAGPERTTRGLVPPFARAPVLSAIGTLAVLLALTLGRYGYHRDELYFRMLPPAWGYIDQPPLTPLIAHGLSRLTDSLEVLRIPPLLLACASVLVVALITREVGGGRFAQGLAAWGYAFGTFTLVGGHVFLTSSIDLVVWPLVLLAVVRAQLRDALRWWLVGGLVAGLGLYNKLLVAALLVAIAVGLLVLGPRRVLVRREVLAGVGLAILVGLPNLLYQVRHGFPQLAMGAALSANHGHDVRVQAVPFLALLLGPPLVPFWVAGLVGLLRRPAWRPVRFLAVTLAVAVVFVIAAGTQVYYDYGVLAAVYAVGCVPVAEFARSRARRVVVIAAVVLSVVVNAVLGLPLVPLGVLGRTPIPVIDQSIRDQVGWPRYVHQIASVARGTGPDAIVLASNYGEAGAVSRFAPDLAGRLYSGHNALHGLGTPPATTATVVGIGYGLSWLPHYFRTCAVQAHLDNGVGVDNEEQDAPVLLCRDPRLPITVIWARAAHLD